jgi:hypothetical protein
VWVGLVWEWESAGILPTTIRHPGPKQWGHQRHHGRDVDIRIISPAALKCAIMRASSVREVRAVLRSDVLRSCTVFCFGRR